MSGKYSLANDYIRLDGIGLPRGVVVAHLNSKDGKITDLKDKYNKAVCYLRDANMSVKRRSKKIEELQAEIDELLEMLEYMIYHEPSEGDIKAAEKLIKKNRSR